MSVSRSFFPRREDLKKELDRLVSSLVGLRARKASIDERVDALKSVDDSGYGERVLRVELDRIAHVGMTIAPDDAIKHALCVGQYNEVKRLMLLRSESEHESSELGAAIERAGEERARIEKRLNGG